MHPILTDRKPEYESMLDHLQGELNQLRTGRASPALVENVPVEAYGSIMNVKGLASISVPDAKTLVIDPWDKGVLKPIEKALQQAGLGMSPVVDGKIIRLVMPQMNEENRREMVKMMKEKIEEARVGVRSVREKTRERVGKMEKDKEIGEDDKYKLWEELDRMTKDYVGKVDQMGEDKEKEIMTI